MTPEFFVAIDFDGTIINSSDRLMTRQVIHAFTDRFPQGQCGRYLYRLFRQVGLEEVLIIPKTFLFTEIELAEQLIGLSTVVESISATNPEQSEHVAKWLDDLKRANNENTFFFMLLGMIAVGKKV